jgi:hypothetical protein
VAGGRIKENHFLFVSLPTRDDGTAVSKRTAPRARSRLAEQTTLASNRLAFVRGYRSTSHWVFSHDMGLRGAVVAVGAMTDPAPSQSTPRTDAEERDYLLKRADDHRRLAAESSDPASRSLHLRFEQLYRDRARGNSDGILQPSAPAKIPGTRHPIDG